MPGEAGAGDLGKSHGLVRTGARLDPVRRFEFAKAHQAVYPIATQCWTSMVKWLHPGDLDLVLESGPLHVAVDRTLAGRLEIRVRMNLMHSVVVCSGVAEHVELTRFLFMDILARPSPERSMSSSRWQH